MRRLLGVAAFIASVTLLLAGCGGAAGTFPTGKWTATNASGDVAVMEFRSDGTWTITGTGQEISAGTYATDAGTLTFTTDTFCKGVGSEKGTYSWTQASDRLTLKKQSDSCTDRVGVMDGTVWKPAQ